MELIDYIKSGLTLIIVIFLVYQYLKANHLIVNLLFIAFALRYFSVPLIGPTIDVLYLFSLAITCMEIVSFLSGRIKVSRSKLILFCLPFFLFIIFLWVYALQVNHYLTSLNPFFWYFKTSANYVKGFLPYFMVGIAVKRQSAQIDLNATFRTILKIATLSAIVSLIQIAVFVVFYQYPLLLELVGLNGGYNYQYSIGSLNLVRVQAFFYEPKSLAAFLGFSIPIAFFLKMQKKVILLMVAGFLTISQTFFVIFLAAFILFVLLKKVANNRSSIICGITIIIAFFFTISSLKNYLLENYASQEETIAYKIFLDRAMQRYSLDDLEEDRELLGIPLQPDIELPAVNFLKDNAIFTLTGFGPGNYNTIPFKYFTSQWNIDAIEKGTFKGHFDMGWIYLIAEFGVPFFLILFFCLTSIENGGFPGKFYSFLWLVFFFHRIDLLLVAFFCLLFYKTKINEDINSYHLVQPG